jgi:hypothetical protein
MGTKALEGNVVVPGSTASSITGWDCTECRAEHCNMVGVPYKEKKRKKNSLILYTYIFVIFSESKYNNVNSNLFNADHYIPTHSI